MIVKTFWVLFLSALILLMSCQKETPVIPPQTITPATTIHSTRELGTPTNIPAKPTATVVLSLPIATSTSSNVLLSPTTSPNQGTPTITAHLDEYDIPDWVLDTSASVLLVGKHSPELITLFNVDTYELYEFISPFLNPNPVWRVENNQLLLSDANNAIDVRTNELQSVEEQNPDIVSPNGRYIAYVDKLDTDVEEVVVTNAESNESVRLFNPFLPTKDMDFYESVQVHWSPNSDFISVRYYKRYDDDSGEHNLVIYTSEGQIFRQYARRDIPWLNDPWNSTQPYKVLYLNDSNAWLPCILDIANDIDSCLDSVYAWAKEENVSLRNFVWSPNGTKISFVYGGGAGKTGFCYFDLVTNNQTCPVNEKYLFWDRQYFSRFHYWSSNDRYVALFVDDIGFMDVVGSIKIVVFDIETEEIHPLEGEYYWPKGDPWRPSVP
jgi:hypothetical protein